MGVISDYLGLIVAVITVAIVIVLQISSFCRTRKKINELGGLFDSVSNLTTRETCISPRDLESKSNLKNFLSYIPTRESRREEDETNEMDYTDISLLVPIKSIKSPERFQKIIDRTNEYLCKNAGTSADLSVLEDICDNQKDTLEEEIHNSLNVPLYLGLAGTFVGIITGLWGIDFEEIFGATGENLDGFQHLLYGIMIAMTASFLGLAFTVMNSSVAYKKAVSKSTDGKEDYMSFLRVELLPQLSNSMAASLNSLRGVLGNFVDRFGRNLDAYADSATLLNDNLEKQHLVLEELNKLSLTKMSTEIANTFQQLKDSSDHLACFRQYQVELNNTITHLGGVASQIQSLISNFNEFSIGLSTVVSNQNVATELQRKFSDAITTHFPAGSDARDIWRKEYDLILTEGKQVSEQLSQQLSSSTDHIKNFVENNDEFFDTLANLRGVLDVMVQYTNVQAKCYNDLKEEIKNMRSDYLNAQQDVIELHKSTLKAVEAMTKAVKDLSK